MISGAKSGMAPWHRPELYHQKKWGYGCDFTELITAKFFEGF